ncbi:MAG: DUF882 domain-containing protein [Pseudomonadota bacterium]
MLGRFDSNQAMPRRAALSVLLGAPAILIAAEAAETAKRRRLASGRSVSAGSAARRRTALAAPEAPPRALEISTEASAAHRPTPRPAGLGAPADQRRVAFTRQETGEAVDLVYYQRGDYEPKAMLQIHRALRDVAGDRLGPIDPRLIDLLSAMGEEVGGREIVVTSAFRTRATNDRLRGAAPNSLHLSGKAVDFFARGVPTDRLARLVARRAMGGVGAYPSRGFVHADLGARRIWRV